MSISYRLIHLALFKHGAPTSVATLDAAVELARQLDAPLLVTVPRLDVRPPSHFLAGGMLAGLAAELEAVAAEAARRLETTLQVKAAAAGVRLEFEHVREPWPQGPEVTRSFGRASDLSVFMMPTQDPEGRLQAKSWVFETGRPCFVVPERFAGPPTTAVCCVAWDGGKPAARAVFESLPLLRRADRVIALVARNEKPLADDVVRPLERVLKAHDISAEIDVLDVGRADVGTTLLQAATRHSAGLLVMGAFGHSRLREFILGGATRRVLADATMPFLMSP